MALNYTPYDKTSILPPQSDIMGIIQMIMMMQQMNKPQTQERPMPGGGPPLPRSNVQQGGGAMGGIGPQTQGMAPRPGQMGPPRPPQVQSQQPSPQMNPQLMMMLMKMLQQGGTSGGMGGMMGGNPGMFR